jgi:DNA-3-methyladenine glycosylase II
MVTRMSKVVKPKLATQKALGKSPADPAGSHADVQMRPPFSATHRPTDQWHAQERVIKTDLDLAEGVAALQAACGFARVMLALSGPLPLRLREPGFEGLARIVVSQQVSVASAAAIWSRFAAAIQPMQPATIMAAGDDELRGAGLSRPKIRTLRAIATAVIHDGLMLDSLGTASNDEVHAALTRVSGIGPWTADIFLMFCLGRADGFPSGDLALQEAAKLVMQLESRPTAPELLAIAERWRPWRSVAARLLWAYYKAIKERDGIGA